MKAQIWDLLLSWKHNQNPLDNISTLVSFVVSHNILSHVFGYLFSTEGAKWGGYNYPSLLRNTNWCPTKITDIIPFCTLTTIMRCILIQYMRTLQWEVKQLLQWRWRITSLCNDNKVITMKLMQWHKKGIQ